MLNAWFVQVPRMPQNMLWICFYYEATLDHYFSFSLWINFAKYYATKKSTFMSVTDCRNLLACVPNKQLQAVWFDGNQCVIVRGSAWNINHLWCLYKLCKLFQEKLLCPISTLSAITLKHQQYAAVHVHWGIAEPVYLVKLLEQHWLWISLPILRK